MRRSCAATILLTCFFSLMVGSRSFVFAQQPPQTSEKEKGIELYRKGDFNGAVKALQKAVGSGSDNFVTPNDSVSPMTATLRPTILYREKARYTEAASAAGVTGTVILLAVFGEDGILKHILAIQGLSHGLTEEAIKAARKIRFKPPMRNGKPVSVFGSLEFTFNLGR